MLESDEPQVVQGMSLWNQVPMCVLKNKNKRGTVWKPVKLQPAFPSIHLHFWTKCPASRLPLSTHNFMCQCQDLSRLLMQEGLTHFHWRLDTLSAMTRFELFHFLKIHRHPPRSKPSHASLAASGSNHNVLELISAVGDSGTSRGIGMFPFPPCRYQLQHIVNRPSSSWYLRTAGPAPPDDVPCARFVSSSGVAHFNSATA